MERNETSDFIIDRLSEVEFGEQLRRHSNQDKCLLPCKNEQAIRLAVLIIRLRLNSEIAGFGVLNMAGS
jgi:hypothetical protein